MSTQGLELARSALAIDPQSAAAWLALAFGQFQNVALRIVEDRQGAWQEGIEAANRALEITDSGSGHAVKACLISHAPSGGRWDEARAEAALNDARQLAPELVQKRLSTSSANTAPEYRRRYDTFLRVAAGLDRPEAADEFRSA